MCWNGEPAGSGVPKNDVAGPVLIVIDTQAARNHFQILNPPVTRITPHFGDEFRSVGHTFMVSRAVPPGSGTASGFYDPAVGAAYEVSPRWAGPVDLRENMWRVCDE